MTGRPVHVVPIEPSGRDHYASATCWCGPIAALRDLSTGTPAWRHRTPPVRHRTTYADQADRDFATYRAEGVE